MLIRLGLPEWLETPLLIKNSQGNILLFNQSSQPPLQFYPQSATAPLKHSRASVKMSLKKIGKRTLNSTATKWNMGCCFSVPLILAWRSFQVNRSQMYWRLSSQNTFGPLLQTFALWGSKMQWCLECWCCLADCMKHTCLTLMTTFNKSTAVNLCALKCVYEKGGVLIQNHFADTPLAFNRFLGISFRMSVTAFITHCTHSMKFKNKTLTIYSHFGKRRIYLLAYPMF